jgi:hypothetical protein
MNGAEYVSVDPQIYLPTSHEAPAPTQGLQAQGRPNAGGGGGGDSLLYSKAGGGGAGEQLAKNLHATGYKV